MGRTSRQAVKGSESSGKALQASGRSAQTMRQTVRTAVQAKLRAVQTAGTARRASETVGRPVVKAVVAALRGTVAAARSLAPLLAAGGGVVFAVVLVLCMVGAILASPLGIFFSLFGENSGGGQQQTTITISAVVQELNQEYDARLDEIRANASYDEESLIGSRAPWSEILAVYAVKTATAPANEQEVVTMTDGKKALLEQIFWDMNELTSFTSTVPGTGNGEEDMTTLYITVTVRTADEMADLYGFNDDQRQQLAELLSDGYLEMWNDAL